MYKGARTSWPTSWSTALPAPWPAAGLLLTLLACGPDQRALVAGQDSCRYCRMTIDDVRFGALVTNAKGRIDTFDSIECVAAFVASLPDSARPRQVVVADFEHPTQWLNVADAKYVYQGRIRSPMGRELAAFNPERSADQLTEKYGGRVIAWNDVVKIVGQQLTPVAPGEGHAH